MSFINSWMISDHLASILPRLGIVFVLSYLTLLFLKIFSTKKLRKISSKTETLVDDLALEVIISIKKIFIALFSVYIAFQFVDLKSIFIQNLISKMILVGFALQGALIGRTVVDFLPKFIINKTTPVDHKLESSLGLIKILLKISLYIVVVLIILHSFGLNVNTLIAGLGVGGIAVALAVQNILGDLFASFTIVLDKPFAVGDFITVGNFNGTVEHIGLKTTRIRSLSGEELIFSNGELLKGQIRNYQRMEKRRVQFLLSVTYQTEHEKLSLIPTYIRSIVGQVEGTEFERCHFLRFADSALEYEVVYWVLDPNYLFFADCSHKINLEIVKKFKDERINFAYPTQTLHLSEKAH